MQLNREQTLLILEMLEKEIPYFQRKLHFKTINYSNEKLFKADEEKLKKLTEFYSTILEVKIIIKD